MPSHSANDAKPSCDKQQGWAVISSRAELCTSHSWALHRALNSAERKSCIRGSDTKQSWALHCGRAELVRKAEPSSASQQSWALKQGRAKIVYPKLCKNSALSRASFCNLTGEGSAKGKAKLCYWAERFPTEFSSATLTFIIRCVQLQLIQSFWS